MSSDRPLLFLSEADVQQAIDMDRALELAELGVKAEGHGEVEGDKFYMPLEDQSFIKPFSGYLRGEELAFVKTFSFIADDQAGSYTTSTVLLLDAKTGRLTCVMEADWITGLKTGASTAITAEKLSKTNSKTVTIFGAGMQGRMHLLGLAKRMHIERFYLIDVQYETAERIVHQLSSEVPAEIVPETWKGKSVKHPGSQAGKGCLLCDEQKEEFRHA